MDNDTQRNRYNGSSYSNGGSRYTSRPQGGIYIKPLYLYIGVAVLLIVAMLLLVRVLNAGLVMHFGLLAGALLLIANLRELIGHSYERHNNTALLNCLIGGGLVCAWLSQVIGALMWFPAVALLVAAVPLTIGRASVYSSYIRMGRRAAVGVRDAAGRVVGRWTN